MSLSEVGNEAGEDVMYKCHRIDGQDVGREYLVQRRKAAKVPVARAEYRILRMMQVPLSGVTIGDPFHIYLD